MISVIQDFEDKVKELNTYLAFLELIQEPDASIYLPKNKKESDRFKLINSDVTPILKANVFLILYNLIEYSIREGVLAIYGEMESSSCSYSDIRDEIRSIWTKYHFKQSFDINSSWETYYKKTVKLIDNVINDEVIRMDRKAIPISGNLDADQVRIICDLHGIKKGVHSSARGGVSLSDVKEQRNLLAHGSLGFYECGRQFRFDQIKKIKIEAIHFVRGILKNMKEFLDSKQFLNHGNAA